MRNKNCALILLFFLNSIFLLNAEDQSKKSQIFLNPVIEQKSEISRSFEDNTEDLSREQKKSIELVHKAIHYLKKNDTQRSLSMFTHSPEFSYGDLYLFVYTVDGICLAHGHNQGYIWKNILSMKSHYGTTFIEDIIHRALSGGGWTTYDWRNTIKETYSEKVEKDGLEYIIGCGYYPHSKEFTAQYLVDSAIQMFNELQSKKRPLAEFFSFLNYSNSAFVIGDLFPWVIDHNGIVLANAGRPGLVGLDYLTYLTSKEKEKVTEAFIKDIEEKLRQTLKKGVWMEYYYDNALKKTYVQEVRDLKEKQYFIGCGFFPSANKEMAVDLVRRGVQYVEAVGDKIAFKEFSQRRNNTFRYGDLYLVAYDLKGICHADGENPEFVGQNFFNAKDDNGRYYVQELIARGKADSGWVQFRSKNAFEIMYVSNVAVGSPEREYIVGCGIYPHDKSDCIMLLVKSAVSYLHTNSEDKAFEAFVNRDGEFIIGDLDITVLDDKGFCYVASDQKELIWQNLFNIQDDNGKKYIQEMIENAKKGATTVGYQLNGVKHVAYVERLDKKGKIFFIVSSFTEI